MRTLLLALGAALCLASQSSAQRVDHARAGAAATAPKQAVHLTTSDSASWLTSRLSSLPLWSAPIASALVPGLGQARLGQERFIAYLAMEAYLITQYTKNNREAADNSAAFRAIARDVARRGFPGARPDTAWQYYEKLEKYNASGSYTLAPSGPTLPETDPLTYNGQQWILARQVYGIPLDDANPTRFSTYAEAVKYYEGRAIPAEYGWNWINASLEKDLFLRAINQYNDASRRATMDIIVLIANHIISTVDAFSSVRLLQSNGTIRASASIPLR